MKLDEERHKKEEEQKKQETQRRMTSIVGGIFFTILIGGCLFAMLLPKPSKQDEELRDRERLKEYYHQRRESGNAMTPDEMEKGLDEIDRKYGYK